MSWIINQKLKKTFCKYFFCKYSLPFVFLRDIHEGSLTLKDVNEEQIDV